MPRLETAHLAVALAALTIVAYLPVWNNGFVDFDDDLYITTNPHVIEGFSGPGLRWALTNYDGHYWQPLSWLSLQFDAHFFSERAKGGARGLSPAAFHAQSLFWHTAAVVLLFCTCQRLTGARWRSFLVAALFAVHPLRVESVAWAAERKDVLSVFFGILTLWAYARYAEAPGWQRYLGMTAAYVLSLMAKPMLMTLPFVLLLVDYWPLGRVRGGRRIPWVEGPSWRPAVHYPLSTLVLEKVPLLLAAGVVGVVTLVAREENVTPVPLSVLPLSARVANALTAYGWYVTHTFFPVGLGPLYPHPIRDWSVPATLAGAGLLLSVTLLSLWQAGRRPWLLVGWLWFVGTLVPVIGLFQGGPQAWADRFTYWPHIGLLVATVWGLAELASRLRLPVRAAAAVAAAALVCLAVMTWVQVGYWHDRGTLWERDLAVTEDNDRAHLLLGTYRLEQRRLDEAVYHFSETVRIWPGAAEHYHALGTALLMLGRLDEAGEQFRAVLQRSPDDVGAWHNLGKTRFRQGEWDKAARCFRKAAERQPGSADSLAMLGQTLWRQGQRSEALEALRAALARDPQQADAWYGLGVAYLAQGRVSEALEALEQALRLRPDQVSIHSDMGVALGRAGRWAKSESYHRTAVQWQDEDEKGLVAMGGRASALEGIPVLVIYQCRLASALQNRGERRAAAEVYRSATERDPRWPEEFAAKAWGLATNPDANLRDPQLACEMAGQAVEGVADPPPALLDTLAAALAARGDFEEAVRTGQRALDKAAAAGDVTQAEAIRDRLQLYRSRKPAFAGSPQ
jgi:tetratricopeptide (TPR) repeat protein